MLKKLLLLLPLVLLVIAACRPTLASAPPDITNQETTPAQLVTPKSPVNASVNVDPRNWPKPDNQPPVLPPPFINKPNATAEERAAWRKEMEEKGIIRDGPPAFGPATKGSTVVIKGKNIKLPDDAYVQGVVLFAEPVVGLKPASETPYFIIIRGKSAIHVTEHTGKILQEYISPNEQGTFDFLKKALQ